MLVFKNNTWNIVDVPLELDPSWGEQERAAFGSKFLEWRFRGFDFKDSMKKAEEYVYGLIRGSGSSGSITVIPGKEHSSPENKKKEDGM
jgi:hypothetical protein